MVITCMQKKVKIKFNSIQKDREITCMQKRMNFKSNSMQPWWSPACRWKGKGWKLRLHTALSLFLALIAWLASMKSTRCIHRSHFQYVFLN